MSTRTQPAHADADPCTRPCVCHDCVDLDADRRASAGYWLAVRCGCYVCNSWVARHA